VITVVPFYTASVISNQKPVLTVETLNCNMSIYIASCLLMVSCVMYAQKLVYSCQAYALQAGFVGHMMAVACMVGWHVEAWDFVSWATRMLLTECVTCVLTLNCSVLSLHHKVGVLHNGDVHLFVFVRLKGMLLLAHAGHTHHGVPYVYSSMKIFTLPSPVKFMLVVGAYSWHP